MEQILKNRVVLNPYVLRQTKESSFSHFEGPVGILVKLAEKALNDGFGVVPGPRDGVLKVQVACVTDFYSGIVEVTPETKFVTTFEPRFPGEEYHITVRAIGEKLPAEFVELILYRRDVLGPHERSAPLGTYASPEVRPIDMSPLEYSGRYVEEFAEWELISINARPTVEEVPMHPLAMARNFLDKAGGTPASYTSKEFAEAIWYWSQRTMVAGK